MAFSRLKRLAAALSALLILAAPLTGCTGGRRNELGEGIPFEAFEQFWYTYDASTVPPRFLRYRLTMDQGQVAFACERRSGDAWPLREEDITFQATTPLDDDQCQRFADCLRGGTVTRRSDEDSVDGGSGPWCYLYWKGDGGDRQVFAFADAQHQADFEALCAALMQQLEGAAD